MKDDAAQHAQAPPYERREPTIGTLTDVPAREAPAAAPRREHRLDESDERFLGALGLDLARGENIVDNVEVSAAGVLHHLVLTDRRLIVRGRDHQTIYPLRGISRLAVVKYIRWWIVVLGLALAMAGAAAAFLPTPLLPLGREEIVYLAGGLFAAGLGLSAFALLRPVLYVEIKTTGGQMRFPLRRKDEALAGFLTSLAQQIR